MARSTNSRKIGAGIFVLALAFRLSLLFWFPLPTAQGVDESEYLALGQNLRFHDSFSFGAPHRWGQHGELNSAGPFDPTAARPPLYPLFIASLWWGDTPPFLALALAQVLLGSLVALLVYLLALRALNAPTATIAGLGMALAPVSSSFALLALSETLFTFLLMCCLWLWGKQRGLLAGLLLGAATLVRANVIVLLPIVGFGGLVWGFNRTVHLRIALGALLVIAPWTVRNALTQHEFIPVATYGWGSLLFYSTVEVPYGSGNPFVLWLDDKEAQTILATSTTIETTERRFRDAALARIASDPVHYFWIRLKEYPRNFLEQGATFMSVIPLPAAVVKSLFLGSSAIFFVLSAYGIYLARQDWNRTYFIALVPLALIAMLFPGTANPRYILPMVPPLMIFAALAAWHCAGLLVRSRGYRRSP